MKYIFFVSTFFLFSTIGFSQLSDGSIAPDWTLEDINGNTHTLYDYLDDGKSVILDFGATWCVPCWNYHNQGILESLYEDFGPDGTDQIMVFLIEGDAGTSQNCIYGASSCVGGTTGDWTTGVNYPILNPPGAQANAVISDYNLNFWPTLYGIAPNGETYLVGQASYSEWESVVVNSLQLTNSFYEILDDGCSGDVDVTTIGGEGDLEYEWSNGFTTEDLIGAPSGIYTLTITDDNNFSFELGPIDLTSGGGNEIVYSEQEDVLCAGEFTGYLYVEAEGGSNDFSFDWSDGSEGPELFNLPGGDYWLTVTDNFNSCSTEAYFFIEESEPMSLDIDVVDADCDEEGEVYIDVDGGSGSFSYNFPDFSTTSNEINLPAGVYEVTVSDLYDCEITETFEILATLPPNAVSSASGDIDCISTTSTLSAVGSSTGNDIMYTWYDASNNIIGTGASISVSNAGNYTLEVFDSETGCISLDEVNVSMNIDTPISVSNYSNAINCSNTTAMVLGTGSTNTGVVYNWSTTDGNIISDPNAIDITVSSGGTYTLQVTNPINGCTASSSVVVPSNSNVPSAVLEGDTAFCEGASTQLCVTSDPGLNISWTLDGVTFGSANPCVIVFTSSLVEVVVTDPVSGCSTTTNTTTSTIPEPILNLTGNTTFCEGGSTMICSDHSVDENISWSDATGQNLGNNNCITISTPGNYTTALSNSLGCSVIAETAITSLAAPTANINGDDIICTGISGMLCADEIGQNYEWFLDGTLVGLDQCLEIENGGTYQLNAANDHCSTSNVINILEESIPVLEVQASGILNCNTQAVTLEALTNGTSVIWTDELGNILSSNNDYTTNLAGQYFATTASSIGCENTVSITVEQDNTALPTANYLFETSALTFEFQDQSSGTINTYLWDFGDGNTSSEPNPIHTYSMVGNYTVCLTVTNDCGANSSCETIAILADLQVDFLSQDISCHGGSDGTIELNISGGVEPYTIVSNPDIGSGTMLTGLSAGTYEFTIQDSNNASTVVQVIIDEPTPMVAGETIVNATSGNSDGSIMLNVSGGTPDYIYLWQNDIIDPEITGLSPGFYGVDVTDSQGCTTSFLFEIQEITATEEIDFIERFSVSPNPASELINIELELNKNLGLSIDLINSLGEIMYESNIDASSPMHQIDITNLSSGIYFINLHHQGQNTTKKIMIIH